jgi:hypothetical protein
MTGKGVGRQKNYLLWIFSFLLLAPFAGVAQTPSDGAPSPVALMTFVGDDLSIGAEFQEDVIGEVQGLGGYIPQPVSAERVPESLDFPPDQPPEPVYLGDSQLVLTGEYYIDMDDLQHFQLWLWNSASGSLVYTDEMVFEDMSEAEGYLPPMVSWIFSHIPVEQRITVAAASAEPVAAAVEETAIPDEGEEESREKPSYNRRFFLGLRGAGFLNTSMPQGSGAYESGVSQGFTGEGALLAEFRLFPFLSLQTEAVVLYDTFKAAKKVQKPGEEVRSTDTFMSVSMMFPLFVKVPLELGRFTLSPFVGAYYTMPLGKMTVIPGDADEKAGSYSYRIDPAFGIGLGIDVGLSLGPGELFMGLRFDRNLGMTILRDQHGMQYSRNRIGLSLGYEFLVFGRRR